MREIVVIQVGQCGNQIGTKFWEMISSEHGIDPNGRFVGASKLQKERLNVYFDDRVKCYTPRSIMIDLDSASLDNSRATIYGRTFPQEYFIGSNKGTGNNFAVGRYGEGLSLCADALEVIRMSVESCDYLQGFQMTHGLGGGTGSGLGCNLLSKLKEEYPSKIFSSFSVIPSKKVSDKVVEPYNCLLSTTYLTEYCDETFCIDNTSLYRICTENLKLKSPSFNDMNHIISCTMSGVTTCFRFPGQLNTDLRKLLTNMVPFPRLHFFLPGYVPLIQRGSVKRFDVTVPELVFQMFHPSNQMAECDPRRGKYLTAAAIFRGRVSMKDVDEQLTKAHNRNLSHFVEWIPNGIKSAVCDIPARGSPVSVTFVGNSTSIQEPLRLVRTNAALMLKKKAFLHWYTAEGMELAEFEEASNTLLELVTEYQQYQDAAVDELLDEMAASNEEFIEDEVTLDEEK